MTNETMPADAASELSAGLELCGTCENFRRYTEKFDVEYHGKHAGTCNSDKFVYDEGSQPPLDGLRYWDYEGYSAGFEVGEKFGCIHWARSNAALRGAERPLEGTVMQQTTEQRKG